jgi:DNA-binding CsgD family transcriptional regulator
MSATTELRVAHWFDVVSQLMARPLTGFPHELLSTEILRTFDAVAVGWNWREADGTFGFDLVPRSWGRAHEAAVPDRVWFDRHPLLLWFARTGGHAPQSVGRVPLSVASPADRAAYEEVLRPLGAHQQLSIPYRMTSCTYRAFVLARDGADFDESDLHLAARLQPAFVALDRHVRLSAAVGAQDVSWEDPRGCLSARELLVLRLLTQGHTADSISRRLESSPRTVHKHLQHIYRKLGVTDRLAAVRTPTAVALADSEDPVASSSSWYDVGRSTAHHARPEPDAAVRLTSRV